MRTGRRTTITTACGMASSTATRFRVVNVYDDLSRATKLVELSKRQGSAHFSLQLRQGSKENRGQP